MDEKLSFANVAQDVLDVATGRKKPEVEVSLEPATLVNIVLYAAAATIFVVIVNHAVAFAFRALGRGA